MAPTIFALSTHPGRAAIAVVRVSGRHARHVYHRLTKTTAAPAPRTASLRALHGPGGLLDHALTLFFPRPNTYTGEDVLELHVHGGTAIARAVMAAVQHAHDPAGGVEVRLAENGEFSKRAFMNGRLDLTELEGVRESIDAETESQRAAAVAALAGGNRHMVQRWRDDIVRQAALLATVIDFGEEHDVAETEHLFATVAAAVAALRRDVAACLRRAKASDVLLRGIRVTLLGPPNAGKSSLLNLLANRDLAIVSPEAGTTRDVLDVPLDIGGYKVVVGDTAGIRATHAAGSIEQEGIRRAKSKALLGDMVLVVVPADEVLDREVLAHVQRLHDAKRDVVAVLNKTDLVAGDTAAIAVRLAAQLHIAPGNVFPVSCLTGAGLDALHRELVAQFKRVSMTTVSDPMVLSARAQDLLENDVLYGLEQFQVWKEANDVVLAAECLRQAVDGIGKITGEAVGVEEILDVVFSSFCIGK